MTETVNSSWSPRARNLAALIALLPLSVLSVLNSSFSALVMLLTAVVSCVAFEAIIQKLLKQKIQINDLSAAVTGIILALLLPAQAAVWHVVLGSLAAIVVAKAFFGGNGSYVFSPALIGRAFLYVSFKSAFTGDKWLFPCGDGTTAAIAMGLMAAAFVYLVFLKVIDPVAPAAYAAVLFAVFAVSSLVSGGSPLSDASAVMSSGALLFAAVFLISDETIIPDNLAGKLIYGAAAALLTWIICIPGKTADGMMFAILVMNAIAPYMNKKAEKAAGGAK